MDMRGSREEEFEVECEFLLLFHDVLDGANLRELPAMVDYFEFLRRACQKKRTRKI